LNPESLYWLLSRISEAAKMVEKFVGTWKMISSDNFDDYMKAIGRRIYLRLMMENHFQGVSC